MSAAWELCDTDQEYRDYVLYLPDSAKHGGRVILTINTLARSASLVITLDREDGDQMSEIVQDGVSLRWALAIAHGVDGFTLPEVAP
jgi:hypothetical protein